MALFIETNSKIIFDKGATKTILVITTKENLNNEELCVSTSDIIGNIMTSTVTVGNFKKMFIELNRFSFVLTLMDRYRKNKNICESLAFVLRILFINIRNVLGIETAKEFNTFIENSGIETINDVLDEQIQERNIVLNCVYIFLCLSRIESNHNFCSVTSTFICLFCVNQ